MLAAIKVKSTAEHRAGRCGVSASDTLVNGSKNLDQINQKQLSMEWLTIYLSIYLVSSFKSFNIF